jgi:polyphosphate kinase
MSSLTKKQTILNRDISWMYFNRRILDEAADPQNPLLERLKFIGIYSSNLDEFFRVRVATLRRMIEIDKSVKKSTVESSKTLKTILNLNENYNKDLEIILSDLIIELNSENLTFLNETNLNQNQIQYIDQFYRQKLSSNLYPLLITRMDQLPKLNDKNSYLAVLMTDESESGEKEFALIQIPTTALSRFFIFPDEQEVTKVMFLDDVIRFCLPKIFGSLKYTQFQAYTIKITRDSEMDFDNNMYQSVLEKVSKAVKNRKYGNPVRLVYDREIPHFFLKVIEKKLNLGKNDPRIAGSRYHNLKDFIDFPELKRDDLKYPKQEPLIMPDFEISTNLMQLIRIKDRYLHYPYHKFEYFIRLLREAAINPEVKAISISIYRLAKNSKIIDALICAALNGKKVTAIVELLARFDESSNIDWAQKMQDAGINVVFGVDGLKVHSKIALIKTKSKSIACISTGNFHEGTASLYTDFSIFTANPKIVKDVEKVFQFIEHPYSNLTYNELIVSPNYTRKKITTLIQNEIKNAKKGVPAYIYMKINHLVDEKIILLLYKASDAGVKIKLLVRGNCSIKTNFKNDGENIEVYGIVDRYLEHSRILIFANGSHEKYFIGSADLMVRNLDNRIEVYTPIYDPDIQIQLKNIIEFGLKDNIKSRIVDGSGQNLIHKTNDLTPFRSQSELYNYYLNMNQIYQTKQN